jgi:hypothetical protein
VKALLTVATLTLALTSTAHAATWQQVTASGGSNIDEVSAARSADGVLHVVWKKDGDLAHTAIAATGKVGATTPIQSGWASTSDPAIVAVPGGLRAFWGGIRTTDASETNTDFNTAFSADGGVSWQLTPGSIIPLGAQAYASDASATTLASGTPLQTYSGTLGTWVHSGLDPVSPNFNFQTAGNYGYDPGIASAADGTAMLAWFSNASAFQGVLAQGVGANGAPSGPQVRMPGSQVLAGGGTLARTPIVARAKSGGYYVAYGLGYPTADQARVWRVGSTKATLLDKTESNTKMALAADPNGRLWAIWTDGSFGSPHVLAARSNPQASEWGQPVDLGHAKTASQVYSVDANATAGAVDVFGQFGIGTTPGGATYVTRVQPGLTLKAKKSDHAGTTFTVTDAGDPVKGAKVKLAGRSGKTDKKGRVTLDARKGTATASADGYEDAKLTL